MRTITSFTLLLFCNLCFCMISCSSNDSKEEHPPTPLQTQLTGTYVELCSEQGFFAPRWDKLWLSEATRYVNAAQAAAEVNKLKSSVSGTLIGAEATAKYGDYPNTNTDFSGEYQFDCHFLQGIAKFIFSGRNITGIDAQGHKVFSHNYSPIGEYKELNMYKYKSDDGNNDEFTYFFICSDTPATTHHIEFRYGSDPEQLSGLRTGKYAYWLASGVREGNTADCKSCIELFVKENLDSSK